MSLKEKAETETVNEKYKDCEDADRCKNAGTYNCHNCIRSYYYDEPEDNFEEKEDEEEW